jgi:hypothetical protein
VGQGRQAGGVGGFRYTELGSLVAQDPAAAADELTRRLVDAGGSLTELCAQMDDVAYRTLLRWLARLADAGHDVRVRAGEALAARQAGDAPSSQREPRRGRPVRGMGTRPAA